MIINTNFSIDIIVTFHIYITIAYILLSKHRKISLNPIYKYLKKYIYLLNSMCVCLTKYFQILK